MSIDVQSSTKIYLPICNNHLPLGQVWTYLVPCDQRLHYCSALPPGGAPHRPKATNSPKHKQLLYVFNVIYTVIITLSECLVPTYANDETKRWKIIPHIISHIFRNNTVCNCLHIQKIALWPWCYLIRLMCAPGFGNKSSTIPIALLSDFRCRTSENVDILNAFFLF